MHAALIYPHQLFPKHPAIDRADICVLVEEPLLFTQYRFHTQKLVLHRAAMRHYYDRLRQQRKKVRYVDAGELRTTSDIAPLLAKLGVTHIHMVDPCDDWLLQRLKRALAAVPIECDVLDHPPRLATCLLPPHRASDDPGNFMLLCEIAPDAIHQWFMELFIDAYDWVMVPNVYGMSQHAYGGLITTKPYISGSSYILKMSNFRKGPWCSIWDALYWRFVKKHRAFFQANPRMAVMAAQSDRMGSRLDEHVRIAETFLSQLHQR